MGEKLFGMVLFGETVRLVRRARNRVGDRTRLCSGLCATDPGMAGFALFTFAHVTVHASARVGIADAVRLRSLRVTDTVYSYSCTVT